MCASLEIFNLKDPRGLDTLVSYVRYQIVVHCAETRSPRDRKNIITYALFIRNR